MRYLPSFASYCFACFYFERIDCDVELNTLRPTLLVSNSNADVEVLQSPASLTAVSWDKFYKYGNDYLIFALPSLFLSTTFFESNY